MDKIIYNVETVMGQEVIWYEKDGLRVSFSADPSNSDYQAYLKSLEETA
jgi:hypothetical protein